MVSAQERLKTAQAKAREEVREELASWNWPRVITVAILTLTGGLTIICGLAAGLGVLSAIFWRAFQWVMAR